jgi:threonine/homoserine/homoserine lactone efflux protein
LIGFLVTTVAISLSGAMAPGPITAAIPAVGTRSRHAGVLVALGHLAVELPLILLLVAGIGKFVWAAGLTILG